MRQMSQVKNFGGKLMQDDRKMVLNRESWLYSQSSHWSWLHGASLSATICFAPGNVEQKKEGAYESALS